MQRGRRIAAYTVFAFLIAFACAWLITLSPSVDVWLYGQIAQHRAAQPAPVLAQPNELSVLLCGTGSPIPDPERASACDVVATGDRLYVIDAGLDSVRNLLMWRVPLEKVRGVLLTHFHSDHIAELGELKLQTWIAGRRTPLVVYGPPGVEDVVAGFNRAYSHDSDYRTLHHGEAFLPREDADMKAVVVPMPASGMQTVLDTDGLKITAIRVSHGPVKSAYGYRFDYAGRSVTISGDTTPLLSLARAAQNTDVLVHEAQSNLLVSMLGKALLQARRRPPAKIMHDIQSYHTTPVAAARIANAAHAKLLVLTHINPPTPNAIARRAFLQGVSGVRPHGTILGYDGLLIHLPGNSKAIERGSLN